MAHSCNTVALLATLITSKLPGGNQMLVVIYKAFHGIRFYYLWDCLSTINSGHLIRSDRMGMVQVLSFKQCRVVGPGVACLL